MNNVHRITRIATVAVIAFGSGKVLAQDLPTTGSIETRSGKLELLRFLQVRQRGASLTFGNARSPIPDKQGRTKALGGST